METQDLLLSILLLGLIFWYFIIRGLNRCIIYELKCDNIKVIKQKTDK